MKNNLKLYLLLLFAPFITNAYPQVVTAPTAYEWTGAKGVNHVFIFNDFSGYEPRINFSEKIDYLYRMNDTYTDSILVGQDIPESDWLMGEDDTYYMAHSASGRVTFYLIDYSLHKVKINSVTPTLDSPFECENVELNISSNLTDNRLYYHSQTGARYELLRTVDVSYTTQTWATDKWIDTLVVEEGVTLSDKIIVPATLKDSTIYTIISDNFLQALNQPADSISSTVYYSCAIDKHPTSIVTTRGTNKENEEGRPIDPEMDPIDGSAPLDVLFVANGSENVKYYKWQILKGDELLAERTNEAEERYLFNDFGVYRVLVWVSNDKCQSDSTEFSINVAGSKLLVPNVFTPNGDGMNDEFRVYYESIIEYEIWVYNRWGKLVYHSTDPARGWDGNINGKKAAEGAYFYVIRAKGADAEKGQKFIRKSKYKKQAPLGIYQLAGDINLLRGKK